MNPKWIIQHVRSLSPQLATNNVDTCRLSGKMPTVSLPVQWNDERACIHMHQHRCGNATCPGLTVSPINQLLPVLNAAAWLQWSYCSHRGRWQISESLQIYADLKILKAMFPIWQTHMM